MSILALTEEMRTRIPASSDSAKSSQATETKHNKAHLVKQEAALPDTNNTRIISLICQTRQLGVAAIGWNDVYAILK